MAPCFPIKKFYKSLIQDLLCLHDDTIFVYVIVLACFISIVVHDVTFFFFLLFFMYLF